ncbi:MAG TPA: molecular chaperone [Syntrophomonas sp.]|jgi:SPX domain protein involved in polyphosphate accumulation|nr:molecular chaperone [Syntrophomonas sp.]HCF71206.1 molecular chaperone [Syntrophomonas sp.]
MAIATFKRYEKKFLVNQAQYDAIFPVLSEYMRLDKFCKNDQEYTIYNIYYDTDNSSIIRHSLAKPFYKEKLRLRTYNTNISPKATVFLELKKKIDGVVTKRRATLTLAEAYNYLDHGIKPADRDYLTGQVLNEIDYFRQISPVRPAAYISYDRQALFGLEDKEFRVTFDRNIISRCYDVSLEKGRFGKDLLFPGIYLMEIKVSRAFPLWLADLLATHGIYATSFSKYGQLYKDHLLNAANAHIMAQAI